MSRLGECDGEVHKEVGGCQSQDIMMAREAFKLATHGALLHMVHARSLGVFMWDYLISHGVFPPLVILHWDPADPVAIYPEIRKQGPYFLRGNKVRVEKRQGRFVTICAGSPVAAFSPCVTHAGVRRSGDGQSLGMVNGLVGVPSCLFFFVSSAQSLLNFYRGDVESCGRSQSSVSDLIRSNRMCSTESSPADLRA